jgi:hypothetical protein
MRRRSDADEIVRDDAFDQALMADEENMLEKLETLDEEQLSLFAADGSPDPESFPLKILRPQTRDDCASVPRPCPFVSCRYNMYLDVREDGALRFNFPDREPHEMIASCALDLASDGPRTLDLVGGLMGVSKERARQLEASGLKKVKRSFAVEAIDD